MTRCATDNCPEVLPVHARRKHCAKCRSMMGRWFKRRPAEILDYSKRLLRNSYRITHIGERTSDLMGAVSQVRKEKRDKRTALFGKRKSK